MRFLLKVEIIVLITILLFSFTISKRVKSFFKSILGIFIGSALFFNRKLCKHFYSLTLKELLDLGYN